MRPLLLLFPALLVSLLACGGNVVTGTGASMGTGMGTGMGAGTGTGGGSTGPCPSSPPAEGSSCNIPTGLLCTYGDSVLPECRTAFGCSDGGMWMQAPTSCTQPPPGDCPAAQPEDMTVCPNDGDVCTFGDVICICNACSLGPCMAPPPRWQCSPPPSTVGCPAVAPNSGTACTMEGLECTYGFVCGSAGAQVTCSSGLWSWAVDVVCGA